jgi:hypothetical protein
MAFGNKKEIRPTATEVAQRLLILRSQVAHAVLNPPPSYLAELLQESSEADRKKSMQEWDEKRNFNCAALRVSGLWSIMTQQEQLFVSTSAYELDQDSYFEAGWEVESAVCLLWALGMISELPTYDSETEPKIIIKIPHDHDHAQLLIKQAKLRKEEEIDDARDTAELWHWRSRTRELEEQGVIPPKKSRFNTLDEVIKFTAAKHYEEGRIPPLIDGDFPAFGKAYRTLTEKEWQNIRFVSIKRHHALNWLCGFAPKNRWDKTPIEV